MRKSMIAGEIPQDWRDANIVPIYKKGPSIKYVTLEGGGDPRKCDSLR